MYRIAVCDDNRELLEAAAERLRIYFGGEEVVLSLFETGEALLNSVREKDCLYQLAILDIELGEMNGIEVGDELNRLLPDCQIIYLTGYLDYAPEVYSTRHTYYVYKPTMEKHLPLALEKAVAALEELIHGRLVLPQKGEQLVLEKQTIIYMERRLRTTIIHTTNGKMTSSLPLGELLEMIGLPAFLRCHNSFAVNLDHAVSFRRESFLMKGGAIVPISNSYYAAVRERFRKYHDVEP